MEIKILLSTCLLLVAGKLSFSQNIAVNTSGAAAAATNMLEVTQTSTAANMVAIYAINSGASPGNTGYGLYSTKTGASTTNIGGYFNASGGTNNYPGIFMGGNVGIGTAGPLSKLHILGTGEAAPVEGYDITNTNVGNVLRVDASGNAVYNGGVIEFGSGLGPGAYIKSGQVNGAQSRLYFGTYKGVNVMTPDLTINNDGYVGIGTTAPAAKLEVAGAVNAIRTNYLDIHGDNGGTSDRPYIRGMNDHLVIAPRSLAGVGNTMYICWPGDMGAGSSVNTRLQETLYISSTGSAGGGNVGIGTASPAAKLEVVGTPSVTIKIVDGNQGAGKVLTSDANGQGSWQTMSGGSCPNPGVITGSVSLTSGQAGVVYSIAAVSGATSYAWTVPTGATITSGQGTTTITVNFGSTFGAICVTAYSASCGTSCPSCITTSCYSSGSQTFSYTGSVQSFTVPCGVTTLTISCKGASGGTNNPKGELGGTGGTETAVFTFSSTWSSGPLIGSNILYVYVGRAGTNANGSSCSVSGGYNGGGIGSGYTSWGLYGAAGGGASDVRLNGTALTDRIIVGGGGGGAGDGAYSNSVGGNGGGSTGGAPGGSYDGNGGTQSAGGSSPCGSCAGSLGVGGDALCGGGYGGGGGGGGYYGGGAGQSAGGGGGSNYAHATATVIANTQGGNTGNGQVVITW